MSERIITYNIQLPTHGFRESEDKGQISKEEALEFFEKFPFLECAKQTSLANGESPNPTLSFKDQEGCIFWISGLSDGGFYLGCVRRRLEIPSETKDKKEIAGLIEKFFDGQLYSPKKAGFFSWLLGTGR